MRLTKTVIDKATYQGNGKSRHILWGDDPPGFGLRVYPSGKKSFVLSYRQGGRLRLLTLGQFGVLTVNSARKKAKTTLAAVLEGSDPVDERRQRSSAATIAELADRYLEEHAIPKKKPSSVEGDRRLLRLHILPVLGCHKIADLDIAAISQLHHGLRSKPIQANRTLALLSKMLNLAEKWGYRPLGSNPCRHVERYRERKLERFLSAAELGRLGQVLAEVEEERSEHISAILAIRLLALTGARKSEVLRLRWQEVDFERGCLRLADSKTGKKVIPLGATVLELLAHATRVAGNPYVCHGERKGQHLVGLQRPWVRIRERAGLEGVRLHDLRHTHAAVAAGAGYGLPIIGKLLGHTQPATTARYAHLADDPMKEAAGSISREIAAALAASSAASRKGH